MLIRRARQKSPGSGAKHVRKGFSRTPGRTLIGRLPPFMRIACPHCHDELDVEEAWAGHEVVCPLCQNGFAVPHSESAPSAAAGPRPKPNRKLEAWNRRRRNARFLFPLAALGLLAASLWGFNRWRGETPPADALRYLASHLVERVTTLFKPPSQPPAPVPAATP